MIKRLAILAALLALAGPTCPTVIEDETVQTKLHLFAAIGQASTWLKDDVSKEGAIESATLWFIIGPAEASCGEENRKCNPLYRIFRWPIRASHLGQPN